MKWLVLGASGTLMAGVIQLAREWGDDVIGIDDHFLPPIGPQLTQMGIELIQGYPDSLPFKPDGVIVGNAIKRGNPTMEWVLNQRIPYYSAPEWLGARLRDYDSIIAICGTHGKTSTAAMLTWVLQQADLNPGYLVAGVMNGFEKLASKGLGKTFVIEADEYDSAFFDKRPKCLHYRPTHLLINNLDYDHADIYPDLESIQQQMRWMIRTVPGDGLIVVPHGDSHVSAVIDPCWTRIQSFGQRDLGLEAVKSAQGFDVYQSHALVGQVEWDLVGNQWMHNALAAITLAVSIGVETQDATHYLSTYPGVARRRQLKGVIGGVAYWDDFAHHPTAITKMLESFPSKGRLIAVFNPVNFTQRKGLMQAELVRSLSIADQVVMIKPLPYKPEDWLGFVQSITKPFHWVDTLDDLSAFLDGGVQEGDTVVLMGASHYDNFFSQVFSKGVHNE
ncbi:MAG TPA: Mur ligase family protein [Gammaproteobacteria bacterium]|nr:Mur ligase family protein [Gammaproteobacteria bacterium]